MAQLKLVTVTLNPALDMTGSMEELRLGAVNVIEKSAMNPGGKGVNVAKILAELGAKVTVTGFLGDENQDPFVHLFAQKQIEDKFVRIAGASRINVKVVEQQGQVTDLNFPGIAVTEDEIKALEDTVFALAKSHEIFVIAGSVPKGMAPERLNAWITALGAQGKKVFFDSSNAALEEGLKAKPWLVKPNDEELSQWAGFPLDGQQALLKAGMQLSETGIKNVVISRGAQGVLWLKEGEVFAACPPKMHVVSTVGAGDTLVAGFCWAQLNAWSEDKTLSFATALSALAVTQINVGVDDIEKVTQLQAQIVVKKLNNEELKKG